MLFIKIYASWLTLYPIYFDAKASQNVRKLSRDKCVCWPLANDIAECAANLGYKTLFEVRTYAIWKIKR